MSFIENWKSRCPVIKFIEKRRMKKTKPILNKKMIEKK
jgi:hypothetical protein